MARPGRIPLGDHLWAVLLVFVVLAMSGSPARATLRYGDLQLSGSFETQNLVRTPSGTQYQFIQNRNTARIRVDYDWFKDGKLINSYEIPFLKSSKLYLLYRGVYDGFYDLAPTDNQRGLNHFDDVVGGPIEGNRAGTLVRGCETNPALEMIDPGRCVRQGSYSRTDTQRSSFARENELREAYIDFALKDIPVSFRIGKQQIIWGESDQFRMMDIWNPLDLKWHLQQEPFTEIRQPLWMIKGLWDIPTFEVPLLGQLSNVYFEGVWNPFDYQPGVLVDFLPRPWAAPINNPLRGGQVQVISPDLAGLTTPVFNLNGTSFTKGDFEKNPAEASGIGGRFHAVTEGGFEFTLNYLYNRGRGIGAAAANAFGVRINSVNVDLGRFQCANPQQNDSLGLFCSQNPQTGVFEPTAFEGQSVFRANVDAEVVHPYVNIWGATGNYFEGDYTQTVFRFETAYAAGIPYICNSLSPDGLSSPCRPPINLVSSPLVTRFAPGFTKRDVWAGMIGADRPTWIRWLNKKSTWFLTGQFFFSYVNGGTTNLRSSSGFTAGLAPYFSPTDANIFPPALISNAGLGQWGTGPYAGLVERVQNSSFDYVNSDNVRRWEMLVTMAMFSFYRGGSIMPFLAAAVDPVNGSVLLQPSVNYFWTNNFIIRLAGKSYNIWSSGRQPLFVDGQGAVAQPDGLVLDPWGAGGLNHRRDELEVRFTFQF